MGRPEMLWAVRRRVILPSGSRGIDWLYVRHPNGEIMTFNDRNAAELERMRIAEMCPLDCKQTKPHGLDNVRVVRI